MKLRPAHIASSRSKPSVREQRAIIRYRKTLDQRINRITNGIRSIFANRGIEIDTGKRAWCTGRVHIDSFRKAIEKGKRRLERFHGRGLSRAHTETGLLVLAQNLQLHDRLQRQASKPTKN